MLAIIGGFMSLATFSASENPAKDSTEHFARQLSLLLNAYREEAVFQNVDLGVAMDRQELLLLSFLDVNRKEVQARIEKEEGLLEKLLENPWQPYEGSSLKSELEPDDKDIEMTLFVEDKEVDFEDLLDNDSGPKPALLFLSSDEYTPFKLELNHTSDSRFIVRLSGDGFSPLLLEIENYDG